MEGGTKGDWNETRKAAAQVQAPVVTLTSLLAGRAGASPGGASAGTQRRRTSWAGGVVRPGGHRGTPCARDSALWCSTVQRGDLLAASLSLPVTTSDGRLTLLQQRWRGVVCLHPGFDILTLSSSAFQEKSL